MLTLHNRQNSFHSAVNVYTILKRKHDDILDKIKPGRDGTKLYDHIVRIIVLLKRLLLQFKQGFSMRTKDEKYPGIKQIGNNASYPFGFMEHDHLQQFDRNSRESCLDDKYLQSIGLDSV